MCGVSSAPLQELQNGMMGDLGCQRTLGVLCSQPRILAGSAGTACMSNMQMPFAASGCAGSLLVRPGGRLDRFAERRGSAWAGLITQQMAGPSSTCKRLLRTCGVITGTGCALQASVFGECPQQWPLPSEAPPSSGSAESVWMQ